MTETWSHLPDPLIGKPRGRPVLGTLKAGTTVFRIHRLGRDPVALNWTVRPDRISGGRFDSLDGSYGYVYVGDSAATAIAETLPGSSARRRGPARAMDTHCAAGLEPLDRRGVIWGSEPCTDLPLPRSALHWRSRSAAQTPTRPLGPGRWLCVDGFLGRKASPTGPGTTRTD